jgi:hypothetical protein
MPRLSLTGVLEITRPPNAIGTDGTLLLDDGQVLTLAETELADDWRAVNGLALHLVPVLVCPCDG